MIGLLAKPWPMTVSTVSGGYDAAFPPSNLTNNDYGRVVQVTNPNPDNGTAYTFDLGVAREVDVLAVLWHNLKGASIIHYSGSNNPDGITNAVYDSGFIPATTGQTQRESLTLFKNLVTLPNPVVARYWRLEFSVLANTVNVISRFFVGKGAKFAIGPQKATLGAKDMNANVTTEVGESRSQEDQNLIRPAVSLSFEYAKQSEMEKILGQYTLALGVSKPMLICTDLTTPYIQDNVAFGRPEKVVTLESSIYDVWSFEAVVTSLGI
jgi:hypothetical protein